MGVSQSNQVLEMIGGLCDGNTTMTTLNGDSITFGGSSPSYPTSLTTTYTDIVGSSITYCPPSGTEFVEYNFIFADKI